MEGRRVPLVDGTTLSGPDTRESPAACPRHANQKRGLGCPLIRVVGLLGFATGAVVGAAIGPGQGQEAGGMAPVRELLGRFQSGDVLVADRACCSYGLVAAVRTRGVDAAIRLHRPRHYDSGAGTRRGDDDHVVTRPRPARPAGMGTGTYHATPKAPTAREVRFRVDRPGYRTRQLVVATTTSDGTACARDIAELYHYRRRVELSIRDIERTLGTDVLRGKAPEMLRRESWCRLSAYDLVRPGLARAARVRAGAPRPVRVAGTEQMLDAFRSAPAIGRGVVWDQSVVTLLHAVGGRRSARGSSPRSA